MKSITESIYDRLHADSEELYSRINNLNRQSFSNIKRSLYGDIPNSEKFDMRGRRAFSDCFIEESIEDNTPFIICMDSRRTNIDKIFDRIERSYYDVHKHDRFGSTPVIKEISYDGFKRENGRFVTWKDLMPRFYIINASDKRYEDRIDWNTIQKYYYNWMHLGRDQERYNFCIIIPSRYDVDYAPTDIMTSFSFYSTDAQ